MNEQIPPLAMFRSFLTVASGFVLTFFVFAIVLTSVGLAFFPEYQEFFKLDGIAQEKMMAEDPSQAIPVIMFWIVAAVTALICVGIGWITAFTAPFAKFHHAIFLAVLLFVTFLQLVISDPQPKKWMDIVYMGAFPIAILFGAKLYLGKPTIPENEISSEADDNQLNPHGD